MLLQARNLSKLFGGLAAVNDVSIDVGPNEIVGLIGPNGAGKSTLFNCLAGDYRPTKGSIVFDGVDVTRAEPERRARLGIGRTYQIPLAFGRMSVVDNVAVGAYLRARTRASAIAKAHEILALVGLSERRDAFGATLGTLGRKRLEIARALATGPRVLFLDETLAGLTPVETQEAIELIRRVHSSGIALVIVEHVMEVIMALAQRVVVMDEGKVIASGSAEDVVRDPRVAEAYLGRRAQR
ncbi:MAG TPA: ABC transporter ATP-binding protein [Candidatus Baltobacteraceae bacterium]